MLHLLFNPLADNGKGAEDAEAAVAKLAEAGIEVKTTDSTKIDLNDFCKAVPEGDELALLGGDGTLNYFVNHVEEVPSYEIYLYPSGTGNDFLNDVQEKLEEKNGLYPIRQFLVNLPHVEVKGKTYRFVNGIGFGIDGECCVVADQKKKEGVTEIDYSKITIDLLLHSFVPRNATVSVDGGEPVELKGAWMACAMNGRCYGGGMKIAPNQERNSGLLTLCVINKKGKIRTLLAFPGIFKGKHVGKKWAYMQAGKTIEVSFDTPCGLQIDGEVVEGVTSYKAYL